MPGGGGARLGLELGAIAAGSRTASLKADVLRQNTDIANTMYRKAFIVLALFAAMPGQAPPAFASGPSGAGRGHRHR